MIRTRLEYVVAGVIFIILITFLLNAVVHARTAVRDDLRKTDMTTLKHGMEMYYNQHIFYPTPPEGEISCTEVTDENSWLFSRQSPLLKEQHLDAIPHDVREGQGHIYRYCATDIQDAAAAGYYLEARLEVEQPDAIALDEDDARNFNYRILHEDGKILYRVCGGVETQCTPPAS